MKSTLVTAASPSNPKLLTVGAAAGTLGISVRSVWRLISRGDIDVVRLGRAVRITAKSIDALIERGGVA